MELQSALRVAGVSALLAIPALLLSGIFLALFFKGTGEPYGALNDFFVALTLLLLVLPAWALLKLEGIEAHSWFRLLTFLTIGGMVLAATGQILLITRIISLNASFATGTLGLLPILAWAVGQIYLGLKYAEPSHLLGWLMAGVVVSALLLTVAASIRMEAVGWALTVVLLGALCGYLFVLDRTLATVS